MISLILKHLELLQDPPARAHVCLQPALGTGRGGGTALGQRCPETCPCTAWRTSPGGDALSRAGVSGWGRGQQACSGEVGEDGQRNPSRMVWRLSPRGACGLQPPLGWWPQGAGAALQSLGRWLLSVWSQPTQSNKQAPWCLAGCDTATIWWQTTARPVSSRNP